MKRVGHLERIRHSIEFGVRLHHLDTSERRNEGMHTRTCHSRAASTAVTARNTARRNGDDKIQTSDHKARNPDAGLWQPIEHRQQAH